MRKLLIIVLALIIVSPAFALNPPPKAGPQGPAGANGKDGNDANVTFSAITTALGYTPASPNDVNRTPVVLTGNFVVTPNMTGHTFTNRDINTAITITFPAAVTTTPLCFCVIRCNNTVGADINLIFPATDRATLIEGNDMNLGESILMTTPVHSGIALQVFDVNRYTTTGVFGVVTRANP